MSKILIFDLQPIGLDLFSGSESFLASMQDLSENELKMTFGGKRNGSKSKSKSKDKKLNVEHNPCCVCMGGGTGGGPN